MYRLTKLIAYDKSGREQTMAYIKEPTTLEYGTRDMYSISSSVLGHWPSLPARPRSLRQNLAVIYMNLDHSKITSYAGNEPEILCSGFLNQLVQMVRTVDRDNVGDCKACTVFLIS